MDQSLIEQLTPVVAGGAMAIVGIVFGRWSERKDSHAAWLRDQRVRAYSEAIAASRKFRTAAGDVYHLPNHDGGQALIAAGNEGGLTRAMVALLGPEAVADAVNALWDAHERLAAVALEIDDALDPDRGSRPKLTEVGAGMASVDAETRFIETAAAALA